MVLPICCICRKTEDQAELTWCSTCNKWFCGVCKRDLKARTKAVTRELIKKARKGLGF